VFFSHENLVVSCITIKETHHLVANYGINEHVIDRHWILVLRCCLVEVFKVNSDVQLVVLLSDWHDTRNTCGISAWPDESYLGNLPYFILDVVVDLGVEFVHSLGEWLITQLYL
jgi:hypothetical protein